MSRFAWRTTALAYVGCWAVVAVGALGLARPSVMATGVALAFVPYAWGLVTLGRRPDDVSGRSVGAQSAAERRAWCMALGLGAVLVTLPPLLSDDLFRYVWDGRVLAAGLDPYAHAPDAAALAHLRNPSWAHINHAELPTIYPPVAALAFAGVAALGVFGPKLLGLAGLLLLARTTPRMVRPARRAEVAYGVALNPLLLAEGPLQGHVDVLAAACFMLALAHMGTGNLPQAQGGGPRSRSHLVRVDRSRSQRVWLFGALATGLKLVGLLLVPLLFATRRVRHRRVALALLVTGAVLLLPVATAGHGDRDSTSGLSHYARRWRGNDGVFGLIERGVERGLVNQYGLRWGKLDLREEPAWLRLLERVGFDPRAQLLGPKKQPPPRELVEPGVLARPLARGVVALLWLAVVASLLVAPVPPVRGARRLVLAALLLAPQLHPWYLALLVPLELITGRAAGMAFAAAVYVAYAPQDLWVQQRLWHVDPLGPALMHGFVIVLIIVELGCARFRPSHPPRARTLTPLRPLP